MAPRPDSSAVPHTPSARAAHVEHPHVGSLHRAVRLESPLITAPPPDGAHSQTGLKVGVVQLNNGCEVPQDLGDVGQVLAEKDRN